MRGPRTATKSGPRRPQLERPRAAAKTQSSKDPKRHASKEDWLLIYSVVLVSAEQQSESVIQKHVSTLLDTVPILVITEDSASL